MSFNSFELPTTEETLLSEEILELGKSDLAISVWKSLSDSLFFVKVKKTLNGFSVLHMFSYLAVGKLVFLPPKGVSCVYGKNTEVKNTSGFQTCRSHFTFPTTLLVIETVQQFFLCPHSNTIYLKS